ncbi:hypothetical protein I3760_05G190000 [Carya illinoinensis]|nr:hypothetical protein I3760_05G190000 [Carya illinoinensis]
MVGALEGKCSPHMEAALSEVIKEKGLMGLYRGWGASCLKVMPSNLGFFLKGSSWFWTRGSPMLSSIYSIVEFQPKNFGMLCII